MFLKSIFRIVRIAYIIPVFNLTVKYIDIIFHVAKLIKKGALILSELLCSEQ